MYFLSSLVVQIGEGDNWQRCLIARKWVCRLLVQSSIHRWLYAFLQITRKQFFNVMIDLKNLIWPKLRILTFCRTHLEPTYPWYFLLLLLLLLLLGPVSDFYSKGLIYHIQASGSPQPIHFLKAHDVSYPNTDENTNTKTKTVKRTMTTTKTPRE